MIVQEEADRYFAGVTDLLSAPTPPAGAGLMPFLPDEEAGGEVKPMPATAPSAPEPVEPVEPVEEPAADEVDPALLEILDPG